MIDRMRKEIVIGFYTCDEAEQSYLDKLSGCDAVLFSVKNLSQVKIKNELNGSSDCLLKMGLISKKIKGACFFSVYTDTFGIYRSSTACFTQGKLLALADMNGSYLKEFSPSFGLKSVKSCGVKYGVLVGSDILDTAALHALSVTENDVIINLSAAILSFDNEKLVSTLAYLYGTPIAFCGNALKIVCTSLGEVIYSGKDNFTIQKLPIKKRYREIKTKVLRS